MLHLEYNDSFIKLTIAVVIKKNYKGSKKYKWKGGGGQIGRRICVDGKEKR